MKFTVTYCIWAFAVFYCLRKSSSATLNASLQTAVYMNGHISTVQFIQSAL